ncbi:MAG: DUF6077 domain-containing protein [Christensenellaceae bacterium]
MILSIVMMLLMFIIVPFLLGALFTYFSKEDSVILSLVFGFIAVFATFQVVVLPCIFIEISFTLMMWIWIVIIAALCIWSAHLNSKRIFDMLKQLLYGIKTMPWLAIIGIALIVAQVVVLTCFMHIDDDDAFYVTVPLTTLETNSMYKINSEIGLPMQSFPARYVFSGYMILCAAYSNIIGIHPAIMMHTIFPMILIPLSYLVFYLIGKKLFKNNQKSIWLFLIMLSVIQIFGNYSVYTTSSFLLFRIWQGKAILANIILPILFLMIIRVMRDDGRKEDWWMLFFVMVAACAATSMGTILAPLMLLPFAIAFAIIKKKLRILTYSLLCMVPDVMIGLAYIGLA